MNAALPFSECKGFLMMKIGKSVEAGTFLPPPNIGLEEQQKLKTVAEKYGQKLYSPDYLG